MILIGMMGSGKSTIGRGLADATGWTHLDNDELVLRSTGMTPRQLLAEHGTDAMRAAEHGALEAALEVPPPAIVAVAGGTIVDDEARESLRAGGIVVWLRAGPEALTARSVNSGHRPHLQVDPEGWIRHALAERSDLYASVADLVVDTDIGSADGAVETILDFVGRIAPCASDLRPARGVLHP